MGEILLSGKYIKKAGFNKILRKYNAYKSYSLNLYQKKRPGKKTGSNTICKINYAA
ncbi:hypothetical protein RCH33_698 [Flavobacterium daejeonense]|nr:hypothetical protein RCH33_698 [Flavobacterium daejeonense]